MDKKWQRVKRLLKEKKYIAASREMDKLEFIATESLGPQIGTLAVREEKEAK